MAIRVGLGAAILAALIILTLLIGADMERRTDALAGLRRELAERASAVQDLARLRNEANQAVPYARALEELLPKPEELVGFPRTVRALATAADVTVSNVSLGAEVAATDREPGSIEAQFTVAGPFENFIAFLKSLEERAGFISFSSIDAPFTNRVNAAMRAKVFSR